MPGCGQVGRWAVAAPSAGCRVHLSASAPHGRPAPLPRQRQPRRQVCTAGALTRVGGALAALLGLHTGQSQGSQQEQEGGAEAGHGCCGAVGGGGSAWQQGVGGVRNGGWEGLQRVISAPGNLVGLLGGRELPSKCCISTDWGVRSAMSIVLQQCAPRSAPSPGLCGVCTGQGAAKTGARPCVQCSRTHI